jgi:hypothetical protein
MPPPRETAQPQGQLLGPASDSFLHRRTARRRSQLLLHLVSNPKKGTAFLFQISISISILHYLLASHHLP